MAGWTTDDIPPQRGRSAVVTGTGGLGYQDALALARAGGNVIIAGRNPTKGEAAVVQICQSVPNATIRFEMLDLAKSSICGGFRCPAACRSGAPDPASSTTLL